MIWLNQKQYILYMQTEGEQREEEEEEVERGKAGVGPEATVVCV